MTEQRPTPKPNFYQPGWSADRLPPPADLGDTTTIRFTLWSIIALTGTAMVMVTSWLFGRYLRRQRQQQRRDGVRRRRDRALRRWQNRWDAREKKQFRSLNKRLRQQRKKEEKKFRETLDEEYPMP